MSRIRTNGTGHGVVGPSDFLALGDLHIVDKQQALLAIEGSRTTSAVSDTSTTASGTVPSSGAEGPRTTTAVSGASTTTSTTTSGLATGVSGTGYPSDAVGPASLNPIIIGSIVGGLALVIIVIVVIVVFVVCRTKLRSKSTGDAYYGQHNDSDYTHLQERGQPPMQGQVNVTASSGAFDGTRESNLYESIADYDAQRAPPLYLSPVNSEI